VQNTYIKGHILSNNLPDKLRLWRKHLGLTQEQFAELAGINTATLRKYEGSHSEPSASALTAYAQTGLNINWLLIEESGQKMTFSSQWFCSDSDAGSDVEAKCVDEILNLMKGLRTQEKEFIVNKLLSCANEAKIMIDLKKFVEKMSLVGH
jgi:transcriptional regulator with XRE-family HTH domain